MKKKRRNLHLGSVRLAVTMVAASPLFVLEKSALGGSRADELIGRVAAGPESLFWMFCHVRLV